VEAVVVVVQDLQWDFDLVVVVEVVEEVEQDYFQHEYSRLEQLNRPNVEEDQLDAEQEDCSQQDVVEEG
jgi:hypothetical protein